MPSSNKCDKVNYGSYNAAAKKLKKGSGQVDTLRIYFCKACGSYHLTKKEYREIYEK